MYHIFESQEKPLNSNISRHFCILQVPGKNVHFLVFTQI